MLLAQSTTYTRLFLMVQSADHVTGLAGATVTVSISKAGAGFGAPSGGATATNIASGWYSIALSATDTNTLGNLAFHCTAASGDPTDFCDQVGVVPANVVQLLGTAWLAPGTAGTPDVNAKQLGGTAQTGRDLGTSVLLSSGTGTGQMLLSSGTVTLTGAQFIIKKNVALSGVTFLMTDTSGTPKTGLSVTAQRTIDGGTLGACANAVTELSGGLYIINLASSDLNGTWITFLFTGSGAAPTSFSVTTQP
jgi:hypothetical protein